ncbi:MAG: hypothetical protein Q4Q53_03275 [Methanocorpusculum sp.]|nr:hypothetical protein [Methanocorpusculum sp.]
MTKDGEIFSAGRKVETAATENVAVGGLQKVTISGEFDDGTTQFLWEGMLNLVDGGEKVYVKIINDGTHSDSYSESPKETDNYYQWEFKVYTSSDIPEESNIKIDVVYILKDNVKYSSVDYDKNSLVLVYFPSGGKNYLKENLGVINIDLNELKKDVDPNKIFTYINSLKPITVVVENEKANTGKIIYGKKSNQVYVLGPKP